MITYKDEVWLYHHGVKGQQWGVRRGPPYPIEDTVLKAGTRRNTVGNRRKIDNDRWVWTYDPKDEWDSKVYRGPFSQYSKKRSVDRGKQIASVIGKALLAPIDPTILATPTYKVPRKYIYDHELEINRDLFLANSKQRMKEFKDLYKRDAKQYAQDLDLLRESLGSNNNVDSLGLLFNGKDLSRVNLHDLKTKKDYLIGKFLLDYGMQRASKFKLTKDYGKIMMDKYDGMVDDFDANNYNEAHDPVILFLNKYKDTPVSQVGIRKVRQKEIDKNIDDVQKELTNKGKKIII